MNIFKRESISKFYDDSPPDIWKIILGDDLHYHVGWGNGDIFDYINGKISENQIKKVLDQGIEKFKEQRQPFLLYN